MTHYHEENGTSLNSWDKLKPAHFFDDACFTTSYALCYVTDLLVGPISQRLYAT